MSDAIYVIDAKTKSPVRVERVGFAEIGVKERADLEAWVLAHPELLGERLLTITSEFDRFDRSSKRLDVLALDEDGALVIVELKLDIAGSHADLQAIRYAAFCSTMTMADVVTAYASHHSLTGPHAEQAIRQFLGVDELPELGNRPRVILAAGSMDDQEITSCVLWLRGFGVDITCVELTPYRMPDSSVVLVPKTVIPLPETREYTVRVEKKEVAKIERSKTQADAALLWSLVKTKFNALDCPIKVGMNSDGQWVVTRGGSDSAHYGWWWMKRDGTIRVGVGFRGKDAGANSALLDHFRGRANELTAGVGQTIVFEDDWGPITRRLYVAIPYDGTQSIDEAATAAADAMARLVKLSLPDLVERGLHAASTRV